VLLLPLLLLRAVVRWCTQACLSACTLRTRRESRIRRWARRRQARKRRRQSGASQAGRSAPRRVRQTLCAWKTLV